MRNRKCYTGRVKFTDYQNIGKIDAFMRTTAPKGYLACDGSTYNIADYPLLCDVFASDFGSVNFFGGNGTTTFAVPDLRGEFLRGTGTNSHTNQGSGANVGTHQDATYHSMTGTDAQGSFTCVIYGPNMMDSDGLKNADSRINNSSGGKYQSGFPSSSFSDYRTSFFTSRPTNTSVLYCIRAY